MRTCAGPKANWSREDLRLIFFFCVLYTLLDLEANRKFNSKTYNLSTTRRQFNNSILSAIVRLILVNNESRIRADKWDLQTTTIHSINLRISCWIFYFSLLFVCAVAERVECMTEMCSLIIIRMHPDGNAVILWIEEHNLQVLVANPNISIRNYRSTTNDRAPQQYIRQTIEMNWTHFILIYERL